MPSRCEYWAGPGPFESPWPQKPTTPWKAPGPAINFPETPVAPVPEPMPRPNPWRGVPNACARAGASASDRDHREPENDVGFPHLRPIVHRHASAGSRV